MIETELFDESRKAGKEEDLMEEVKKPMAIEDRVKKIIAEQLGVDEDEVVPEASFVEDLERPDEDAEKILTVGKAMEYIKEKV